MQNMSRLWIVTAMMAVGLVAQAQQSTIGSFKAVGLLPQYDESFKPVVGVVAQMDVTYSRLPEGQGGVVVVMNNGPLPQVNNGYDLVAAMQNYVYAGDDLPGTTAQKTERMEVFLPLDDRLKGKAQTISLQAFVLYDDGNDPHVLAKSRQLTVNPQQLTMLQQKIDQEEMTSGIKRDILGGLLKGAITNPSAVDEDGYKPCPICKGKGELSDDSYNHAEERESGKQRVITITRCKECDGTGRVKASDGDLQMKRSAEGLLDKLGVDGGDLFDIFFGSEGSKKINLRTLHRK